MPSVPEISIKSGVTTGTYQEESSKYYTVGCSEQNLDFLLISRDKFRMITEISSSVYVTRWAGIIQTINNENTKTLISCGSAHGNAELQLVWRNYVGLLFQLPDNKNTLQTIGICYQNDYIYVVQCYQDMVSLHLYLKNYELRNQRRSKSDTYISLITVAYGVVSGIEFLASHKCCHPGLCPHTIIVDAHDTCKLYDFCTQGDAIHILEHLNLTQGHCIRKTWPPESYLLGEYTSASDVWSVGAVLWEIFSSGAESFNNFLTESSDKTMFTGDEITTPLNQPTEIFEVIKSCCVRRISQRPTIFDVVTAFRCASSSILKQQKNGTSDKVGV